MSAPKTSFGWAVLYPLDKGFGSPGAPCVPSVASTRDGAIEGFADQWRTLDEAADHHSIVWRRAYRRGWRVSRVSITPSHGYSQ